jgi:hypothetical protein
VASRWDVPETYPQRRVVLVFIKPELGLLSEHPLPIRQRLLIQRDRAAQVPRRLVGAGEVVPRRQRVAMVAAAVCAGGTAAHGVMALRLFDESVSATRTEPQR